MSWPPPSTASARAPATRSTQVIDNDRQPRSCWSITFVNDPEVQRRMRSVKATLMMEGCRTDARCLSVCAPGRAQRPRQRGDQSRRRLRRNGAVAAGADTPEESPRSAPTFQSVPVCRGGLGVLVAACGVLIGEPTAITSTPARPPAASMSSKVADCVFR
jgi:hypothetical protein